MGYRTEKESARGAISKMGSGAKDGKSEPRDSLGWTRSRDCAEGEFGSLG
jgi:hypothetical protein